MTLDNIHQKRLYILKNTNIVDFIGQYTKLKKSSENFLGLCPFHKEDTPSFVIDPRRNIFNCFGCGESGNVVDFFFRLRHTMEGYTYEDCVNLLAFRLKETLKKDATAIANEIMDEISKEVNRLQREILNTEDDLLVKRKQLENSHTVLQAMIKKCGGLSNEQL